MALISNYTITIDVYVSPLTVLEIGSIYLGMGINGRDSKTGMRPRVAFTGVGLLILDNLIVNFTPDTTDFSLKY